jgi:hypothetical protein
MLRVLTGVLALLVNACGDAAVPPASSKPNIVLVSIDSLRADHLGSYGYARDTSPFLDRLAREGTRFENAISTTSWTLPAHAAMFTGLQGSVHGLVDNGLRLADGHLTLAEILRREGYGTAGFFGGPYLHPTFGVAQGFDVYESCMTTIADDTGDADVRSSARKVIEVSRGGDAYLFDLTSNPEERDPIGPDDASGAEERRAGRAGCGSRTLRQLSRNARLHRSRGAGRERRDRGPATRSRLPPFERRVGRDDRGALERSGGAGRAVTRSHS